MNTTHVEKAFQRATQLTLDAWQSLPSNTSMEGVFLNLFNAFLNCDDDVRLPESNLKEAQ